MQRQKKGFLIQNGKRSACDQHNLGSFNRQTVCMQISTRRLLQMNEIFFRTGRGVFKYKEKNLGAFLYGPQEHICLVAMTTLGFTQFKESIEGGDSPQDLFT
jgi:hypothetical protein